MVDPQAVAIAGLPRCRGRSRCGTGGGCGLDCIIPSDYIITSSRYFISEGKTWWWKYSLSSPPPNCCFPSSPPALPTWAHPSHDDDGDDHHDEHQYPHHQLIVITILMMMVILINIRLHTKPEKEAGRWEFDLLNSFLVEEQTFNIGYFSGW